MKRAIGIAALGAIACGNPGETKQPEVCCESLPRLEVMTCYSTGVNAPNRIMPLDCNFDDPQDPFNIVERTLTLNELYAQGWRLAGTFPPTKDQEDQGKPWFTIFVERPKQ